jgi:hypothetical protein
VRDSFVQLHLHYYQPAIKPITMPTRKKSIATPATKTAAKRKVSGPASGGYGERDALLSRLITMSAERPNKPTKVKVTFTGGVGMITATLFQNLTGAIIGHDSLTTTGMIIFNNAGSGDVISVNGACTGKADIKIDVTTDPATPVNFTAGNINFGFDIL